MKRDYYLFKYNGCKYGKKILFHKGELKILKNGLTLITGENGCGKSTLIKKVFYNNYNASTMVSQENDEVFGELSIKENLSMMQESISDEFIENELNRYGLAGILNKIPAKLSGGEKRLVSIIRGLWSEREIIFLDEPTNDLDYRIVEIIVKIISDYKYKKTFIIVTHDERLHNIADFIYEISNEKVIETRKFDEKNEEIILKKFVHKPIDSNLFHTIFKRDYLFLYFTILITILTATFFVLFIKKSNVEIESLKDSHIEMCNTVYGNHSELISQGFLPTSIINSVSEDDAGKTLEYVASGSYSFGLDIESTDKYDVYNMILFDMNNSLAYSVTDTYAMEIIGEKENYNIDFSELFILNNLEAVDGAKTIIFGQNEYDTTYTYIRENCPDAENIFVVIKLEDGYTFEDFIIESHLEELLSGDYYIRSNETIEIVENAIKLSNVEKILKNWVVVTLIICVLIFYYIYLSIKVIKKKVQIIANYGFDKKEILLNLVSRCVNKKTICVLIIVGEAVMTIILIVMNRVELDYLLLVIPVCYIAVICATSYIYNLRIRKCVQKIHKVEGEF